MSHVNEMIREKLDRNYGVTYPAEHGNMDRFSVRALGTELVLGPSKPDKTTGGALEESAALGFNSQMFRCKRSHLGHPSGGFFFSSDFLTACCHGPFRLRTSGLGSGVAFGFAGFFRFTIVAFRELKERLFIF